MEIQNNVPREEPCSVRWLKIPRVLFAGGGDGPERFCGRYSTIITDYGKVFYFEKDYATARADFVEMRLTGVNSALRISSFLIVG